MEGNIADAVRFSPWLSNNSFKADPYEHMAHESGMYLRWYADNMWLFVPIQQEIMAMAEGFFDYPFRQTLSVSDVGYKTIDMLQLQKKLKQLQQVV